MLPVKVLDIGPRLLFGQTVKSDPPSSHREPKWLLGCRTEAGLRAVVREIGLRIYWFKQEDFLSLVTMLSHRITERSLGDRHSAESPDIGNVRLLSHRI